MSKKSLQAYGKMKAVKDRNRAMEEAMKKSGLGAMTDYDMENITSQKKHNFIGKGAMTDKDMEMLKKYSK
jgi:hypothetical protein